MIGTIGLGSNLGDRRGFLQHGLRALPGAGVRLLAVSSVWESEPVDSPAPEWFLNMAVQVDTDRRPLDLLDALLEIERSAGRVRREPNGPRTLDLDLLTLGDLLIREPRLALPHPRMWARRFVLEPLAEILPDLRNPSSGRTVVEEAWRIRGSAVVYKIDSLPLPEPSLYNPASIRSDSTHEVQIDRG